MIRIKTVELNFFVESDKKVAFTTEFLKSLIPNSIYNHTNLCIKHFVLGDLHEV